MNEKILVIDDDAKLIDLLSEYLATFNFKVSASMTPEDGLRMIRETPPDLVVLDVMLPGMDGFTVCREIRKESDVPIIMLTARGEVTDRIVGLEIGADDYLAKPFEPRELVARIQTILRRVADRRPAKVAKFADLHIDYHKRAATLNGEALQLTTAEFEILVLFTENPGRVLDRDQILEHTRGIEWAAADRSVDVLVSRLRSKLKDDPKNPRYFRTVWGAGYVFIGNEDDAH